MITTGADHTVLREDKLSHLELAELCSKSPTHPAWYEFYQRFDKWIRIYITKTLRGKNKENNHCSIQTDYVVAELVQDVYVKLLADDQKALRSFNGITDNAFLAYLSTICANTVYESHRKVCANKRSAELVPMEATKHLNLCGESSSTSYLAYLNINEIMILLDKVETGRNSRRNKLIFKLHLTYGFTVSEIAKLPGFNLRNPAIQSIIARTRNKIVNVIRGNSQDKKQHRAA
ncbi:MAG: sigma-70 family RNA polymerase sigma factor [Acidobacteriota bacterium]